MDCSESKLTLIVEQQGKSESKYLKASETWLAATLNENINIVSKPKCDV